MSTGFYSTAIQIVDQHPQLGELRYIAVMTIPYEVPTDRLDRTIIRALRLAHHQAVKLTHGDL